MSPALPARAALLLDVDGTLLDLAPRPDAVVVPDGLLDSLRALRRRLEDALAVVTGRPIEQIDGLLADAPYAVAGEHGGAVRHAPDDVPNRVALPDLPSAFLAEAEAVVSRHPGTLLERKPRGFALHYRQAPEAGEALGDAARRMLDGHPQFALLPAHMAWEVKPKGADKGTAVALLMARPPFLGRVPVYIGDDVTDEDGIRAAQAAGGVGWRVQEAFGTPNAVRTWLASQAVGST